MTSIARRSGRGSPLLFIFVCVFIDMLGYGMIVPLLPFLVGADETGDALLVGLLSSLYALMQLIVAPLLGAISDQVGRRPVLVGCLALAGGAYLLLGLAGSLAGVVLAVAVAGAAGATIPTAQAYIADSTPPEERARGLGLVGAAYGLGLMLGPAAGGLLSRYGLGLPAFAAAALALLNVVYGLLVLPESLPAERRGGRAGGLLQLPRQIGSTLALAPIRLLLVAIVLLNLAFSGLQSNFPLFSTQRFGWGPVENGLFFAFVGVCAAVTQGLLIGRLQPIVGEPPLVVGGLGLMSFGLLLVALAEAPWMLYPLVGTMAVGVGLAIPAVTSLVSRRAGEGRQGAVMGGMQSLLSLTLVVGPALAGGLAQSLGASAPYLAGGALAGIAATVAAIAVRES